MFRTPDAWVERPGQVVASVEVRAVTGCTAVVTLIGDHDLSMKAALLKALDDVRQAINLIIDLRPCTFVDSTIIAALLTAFRVNPPSGQRVSLVAPADTSYVMRALSVVGVGDLLSRHDSIDLALESLDDHLDDSGAQVV